MIKFVRIRNPVYCKHLIRWRSYYTKLSYLHNPGKEPLKPLTIGKLLQISADKFSNRLAIISRHQREKLTYQGLLERSDNFAAGLLGLGLKKGDRIGMWAPNIIEYLISAVAAARGGLILVPINIGFQAKEIEYCINKVGIKAMICSHKTKTSNLFEVLQQLSPELEGSDPGKLKCYKIPSLATIITIADESLRGTYNFNEILDMATTSSVKAIKDNQNLIPLDHPFNIQFTSGTTGSPKAAVVSHFQIVNNSYLIGKRNELNKMHHTICVQSPFFHAFGLAITVGSAFHFGSTLVLPSPIYSPQENLNALAEERCTIVYGTPTMYVDLVNLQRQQKKEICIETAFSGGAVCSPHLFKQMMDVLKVKKVKSVYGLTEATGATFHSLAENEDEFKSTSTVGYVGDHLEVKIVDGDNNIVPFGTPGELCIRGYNVMLGYWDDEKKTKEILGEDKWMKTGDQFILQEDGYGRIVGRLKDMIIRGGENIYPKEVEDFLNTHPSILEAHVIGIKHERLGEEVCVCVRLKEGATLTHESLVQFCKGNIANYKIPSRLETMDKLPKTLSGKVQKYLLKKQFEE